MNEKQCCGTCAYHQYRYTIRDGWICGNISSDYFADYTEYDFCCEEWEDKDE